MVALDDVRSRLCLFKLKLSAAVDDRLLMSDIEVEYLGEREYLRLVVYEREHIYSAGVLELRVLVELIENYLTVGVALVLDNDTHTVSARLVAKLGDTLNSLILNKSCDSLAEHALVDSVGYLGNYDPVLVFFDIRLCANHDSSLTRGISLKDAVRAVDSRVGRKIGALEVFHKLGNSGLGVVHTVDGSVDNLTEIVRGNIGRHTYGDTHSSVYEQVREARGKHLRLTAAVVEVGNEVNDLFLKIRHKLVCYLRHSRLGVTVSSRAVAVNRAEVSVTLYERIAVGKVLRHTNHSSVNGRVSVRMVAAENITDRSRRLTEGSVVGQVVLVHSVHYSSLTGLHTVANVGKRTGSDYGHRVFDEGFFDFLLHLNVNYFLVLKFYVLVFHFVFLSW